MDTEPPPPLHHLGRYLDSARKVFMARVSIVATLLRFFWAQKLWWMIPLLVVVILGGFLVLAGQQTALAPFIYVLF